MGVMFEVRYSFTYFRESTNGITEIRTVSTERTAWSTKL